MGGCWPLLAHAVVWDSGVLGAWRHPCETAKRRRGRQCPAAGMLSERGVDTAIGARASRTCVACEYCAVVLATPIGWRERPYPPFHLFAEVRAWLQPAAGYIDSL